MLRRKKRRIAHGVDNIDVVLDGKFKEVGRHSVFTRMQSKWGRVINMEGGFLTGRKREPPRKVLMSKRMPGIKLKTRMLLRKVKDKCGKFFSASFFSKRKNGDVHTDNVHCTAPAANVRAGGARAWIFRSPSKAHHHLLHQKGPHDHQHQHPHTCNYPLLPSLADANAIAECIEFIKRSSSASSSSSSTSSTSSSSLSMLM